MTTLRQELADGSDAVRVRFGEVDGLKGLAVLAIVAYQAVRFAGLPPGTPDAMARLSRDASQGLTLFLVLSAFALAYPPLAALRAGGTARLDLRAYVARRLLRVWPAYLVVLGAAAGLAPLAALFGLPNLAAGMPAFDLGGLARAAAFTSDGFGNDGFRAVDLIVRSYLVFPALLALWIRFRPAAIALALGAAALDVFTAAGGWGVGAVVPLVLGIAAADLRVRGARFGRFGLPLAAAAIAAAWFAEPHIAPFPGVPGVGRFAGPHVAQLPGAFGAVWFAEPHVAQIAGALGAGGGLRIDPLWALAAFGLLAGIGWSPALARAAGFAPFRLLGAMSYAISLVAMPVCAFAGRQISAQSGPVTIAVAGAGVALALGFMLWQTVDRWFGDGATRLALGRRPARLPENVPASAPADRDAVEAAVDLPAAEAFSVPPARMAGPVAVLSTHSGSAADFAAEILETKRRLSEAPAVFFPPQPETAAPKPVPGPIRLRIAPPSLAGRAALPAHGESEPEADETEYEDDVLASVADLASSLAARFGKSVTLRAENFDTRTLSPDRRLAVKDVLIQLARNSVVHGIESADERAQAGKPRTGTIAILPAPSLPGGSFGFTFRDDGRGLDVARIRERALARGFLAPEAADDADDETVAALIFLPGFSTSDESPAGLGLHLIERRVVDDCGGELSVDSHPGESCTFSFVLPERAPAYPGATAAFA